MRTTLGQAFTFFGWACIFAGFGYLIYLIFDWLLSGPGIGVFLLGLFVAVIYLLFGWLPDFMSKRWGQTRWQSERSIGKLLFVLVGFVLGFYWIPRQFNFNIAWYWRGLVGIAMIGLGLVTRR